jgi:hypothetical protein
MPCALTAAPTAHLTRSGVEAAFTASRSTTQACAAGLRVPRQASSVNPGRPFTVLGGRPMLLLDREGHVGAASYGNLDLDIPCGLCFKRIDRETPAGRANDALPYLNERDHWPAAQWTPNIYSGRTGSVHRNPTNHSERAA